mmetsp:Transcript_423/g.723  ORF Transcript_423/g.723 Transcript_423/m.723 type:complete len:243 (+) Transcript_423:56-784(+)
MPTLRLFHADSRGRVLQLSGLLILCQHVRHDLHHTVSRGAEPFPLVRGEVHGVADHHDDLEVVRRHRLHDHHRRRLVLCAVLLYVLAHARPQLRLHHRRHAHVHLGKHVVGVVAAARPIDDPLLQELLARKVDGVAVHVQHDGVQQPHLLHLVHLLVDPHHVAHIVGVLVEQKQQRLKHDSNAVSKNKREADHDGGEGGKARHQVDPPNVEVKGNEQKVHPSCEAGLEALHDAVGVLQRGRH